MSRLELQTRLETILGSRNVYFQPPESIRMSYPAIVYSLSKIDIKRADNSSYNSTRCYEIVLIDKDPDSEFIDKIIKLPMCSFVRSYRSNNLNHFVFELFI